MSGGVKNMTAYHWFVSFVPIQDAIFALLELLYVTILRIYRHMLTRREPSLPQSCYMRDV